MASLSKEKILNVPSFYYISNCKISAKDIWNSPQFFPSDFLNGKQQERGHRNNLTISTSRKTQQMEILSR